MNYQLQDQIAVLTFDDGKANAVGHSFVDNMMEALEKAGQEAQAVIIKGKAGMFSAGFDLKEFKKGPEAATALVSRGEEMLHRLFSYPLPIVAACEGHAIGLGAFLLLAADTRIGADADYQVTLPETAIGMPFTPTLMALIKHRVNTQWQTQTALQSRQLTPSQAAQAGFLDEVVSPAKLYSAAMAVAQQLAGLPAKFYQTNKLDLRREALAVMTN